MMDFNINGLIEPGLHEMAIEEFIDMFIKKFEASQRRRDIFSSLVSFIKDLISYDLIEIWLDGSYTTEKNNPNDIDIIIFVGIEDFINIQPHWNSIRNKENIDAYIAVAANEKTKLQVSSSDFIDIENNRNYWRGQFGFDRNDKPKGIIITKKEEWEKYFSKRGDSDVISIH